MQQHHFPRWVVFAAFFLTFIAGYLNAMGILGYLHQGISHLSGISTLFAINMAENNWIDASYNVLLIISFVLGAMISAFIIGDSGLKLGKRYGSTLLLEATLLTVAYLMLLNNNPYGQLFTATACGLQNAMTSSYTGNHIRTTHVTGTMTDIGIMLGRLLHGNSVDKNRLFVFILTVTGYISGGCTGTYFFNHYQYNSLILPIIAIGSLSIYYWFKILSGKDVVS